MRHAAVAGYRAHVLFLRPGPAAQRLEWCASDVRMVDAGRMRSPRAVVGAIRAVADVLDQTRPDVVVGMEPSAQIYVAAPARRRRIPVVWQQHACVDPRSVVERVARRLPAQEVIANSSFVAGPLRSRVNATVTVVHPGIDRERFATADGGPVRRDLGLTPEAPVVGIVARLQPWKGQDVFLRAAARIAARRTDAHFLVVGGAEMGWEQGDYPRALRDLAQELGIADRVTFTGQVDDPAPWTAACDVVVSASTQEPFGMAICEAQAAGRAVVAVAEGGPLEIIEDGVSGLLRPRDPIDLAEAVLTLLADGDLRRRVESGAAATARDRHDGARMACELGRRLRAVAA